VADFENLHVQIVRRPPMKIAAPARPLCGWERERQGSPEPDIHKAKGLECVSCHPVTGSIILLKGYDSRNGPGMISTIPCILAKTAMIEVG